MRRERRSGAGDRRRAGPHTLLLEDVLQVLPNGLGGDEERGGDLGVRPAASDPAQHLSLARREAPRRSYPSPGLRADADPA